MKESLELIRWEEDGNVYVFTFDDFGRVESYCENECLGIQFLISANILRMIVKHARKLGAPPPLSLKDLSSSKVKKNLLETGDMAKIKNDFGTTDLKSVAKITIKQTYNFIHKL